MDDQMRKSTAMLLPRRRAIATASAVSLLLGAGQGARAEDAPIDAVHIVSGFSPTDPSEALCSKVAAALRGTSYAKSVVLDNKTGSAGQAAVRAMKGAPTDGSVLLETPSSALIVFPYIYKDLGYDIFTDLTPVTLACTYEFALAVGPAVPQSVKTVPDFLAWCKASPANARFGSPGVGSVPHFIGVALGHTAGVMLKHVVYPGSHAAVRDLVAGKIPAVSGAIGIFLQEAAAGKIRLLGVSGKTRSRFAPDVPTYAEQGLQDMVFTEWYGFFAPGDTSVSVVLRANAALRSALKRPDVVEALAAVALEAKSSTPAELALRLKADHERWGPLVKKIGFSTES